MAQISVAPAPVGRGFAPLDRPIRWGIMSTGAIARQWATTLTGLSDEARVVAVGSRTQAGADEFARTYSIPVAHGSNEALATDPEVDVVYVSSPHSHHLEHALLAIRSGKHLLVEKPLTVSQAESRALFEAAAEAGVFVMEALWSRCNPLIRRAQQLIENGAIGQPRLLTASFTGNFSGDDSHRLLNPDLAGGAILDLGVYPAHIAAALLGRPSQLTAQGTMTSTGVDATSLATPQWQLADGSVCVGSLSTSIEAGAEVRLEVVGTEGRLVIPSFLQPPSMVLHPRGGEPQEFVASLNGYAWQAQEVHRCLQAGLPESPRVPWQSSLDVAAMLDAWLAEVRRADTTTADPVQGERSAS